MAYNALIDGKISTAFRLLKDLSIEAVFKKTSNVSFNFSDMSMDATVEPDVIVKIVVVETKKDKSTVTKTLLAKGTDLGMINNYSTLSFEGQDWKIGTILRQTGRVWMFEVFQDG